MEREMGHLSFFTVPSCAFYNSAVDTMTLPLPHLFHLEKPFSISNLTHRPGPTTHVRLFRQLFMGPWDACDVYVLPSIPKNLPRCKKKKSQSVCHHRLTMVVCYLLYFCAPPHHIASPNSRPFTRFLHPPQEQCPPRLPRPHRPQPQYPQSLSHHAHKPVAATPTFKGLWSQIAVLRISVTLAWHWQRL